MEKCFIPGCRHYNGIYTNTTCRWHLFRFQIGAIIAEEMRKHLRVAIPIHDRRTNKLQY